MISAIVHTFNEEKNIDRCLCALEFAGEIVVIDMGSSDKTLEIAKTHKVRIFNHAFTGFVESARNFGIEKAEGEWILIVDADEVISHTLKEKILALSKDKNGKQDFFRLPRKNIIFGKWIKHTGWWPDYQIRFFKKGSVSWNNKIHGIPLTRGLGMDLEDREELSIVHYHYLTIGQYLDRLNRYTSVQAKEYFLKSGKITLSDLILNPVNEFVRRFFALVGYRDGWHGLSLSLLQAFSEFIVVLKVWELSRFPEIPVNLTEVESKVNESKRIVKYWFINESLKKPASGLKTLLLRIRRRFYS